MESWILLLLGNRWVPEGLRGAHAPTYLRSKMLEQLAPLEPPFAPLEPPSTSVGALGACMKAGFVGTKKELVTRTEQCLEMA